LLVAYACNCRRVTSCVARDVCLRILDEGSCCHANRYRSVEGVGTGHSRKRIRGVADRIASWFDGLVTDPFRRRGLTLLYRMLFTDRRSGCRLPLNPVYCRRKVRRSGRATGFQTRRRLLAGDWRSRNRRDGDRAHVPALGGASHWPMCRAPVCTSLDRRNDRYSKL
jgi:hypothetical protein